ncbi:hypothetical protein KHP60_06415 [Microvirga sp. 3-52]|uniref:hypothetical protein n=1 Tax=Microvirga sp. 3-52 TaxID=2792425 RepID=UPI001AC2F62C|nr:hypothetical protein [Microvirga sp. 3-52]MBO1904472.1 hypothetical protein [Microvirga sp. 3-52]MBS7451983.1 hypothetical protein [Microvirga sp. 3-52]
MPSSPTPPWAARWGSTPKETTFPGKTDPGMIEAMRKLVERTRWSCRHIGAELGISAATVSRYIRQEGWQRPTGPLPSDPAPADPASSGASAAGPGGALPEHRRGRIMDKLWQLAERHAEVLEAQPIALAQHSAQPLARLTRVLGEIEKHTRAAAAVPAAHDYAIDAPKPRRTLHELRDELAAHLERIQREEGYGWEVREWWLSHGGGI